MSKMELIAELKKRLAGASEIKITVTGRKSGRAITVPIWFVLDGDNLELLPVSGSDTQWYKNVLKNSELQLETAGKRAELRAEPLTDAKQVSAVVEKFRAKYGAGDVKKYYSKFDVAVVAPMR